MEGGEDFRVEVRVTFQNAADALRSGGCRPGSRPLGRGWRKRRKSRPHRPWPPIRCTGLRSICIWTAITGGILTAPPGGSTCSPQTLQGNASRGPRSTGYLPGLRDLRGPSGPRTLGGCREIRRLAGVLHGGSGTAHRLRFPNHGPRHVGIVPAAGFTFAVRSALQPRCSP